ncbi:MAG: hypothetical protein G01um101424_342 [Parcubacteria group bacterium Gr01-1014_24]|nr:MAG: hypothetical protein G01um101424_342 [Parcubacteria group bacterium Gr01-1014_24]
MGFRSLVLGFGFAVLVACSGGDTPLPQVHAATVQEAQDVSLVQLIANPSQYDGKLVRVIGFCRLEFEGNALYLHREDFEHSISKNAVWLQVGWPVPENLRAMSDEYVIVEATFSAEHKGHFGAFSGSLDEVKRLDRWGARSETERFMRLQPPSR